MSKQFTVELVAVAPREVFDVDATVVVLVLRVAPTVVVEFRVAVVIHALSVAFGGVVEPEGAASESVEVLVDKVAIVVLVFHRVVSMMEMKT